MLDGYVDPINKITAAKKIRLITPHDTNDLVATTKGISFAAAGTLKVLTVTGDIVTIPSGALAAGIIHPIAVKRVYSAGTTATGIVGYF